MTCAKKQNIKFVKEIGKLVKNKRKKMKIRQADAAALCNVGTRFFSELENGKPTLEIDKVLHVLQSLGLSVNITNR